MIYKLVSSWGPKQFPHKDKDFVPITHMNLKQTHRCQLLRDHNMVNGLFIVLTEAKSIIFSVIDIFFIFFICTL